MISLQVLLHRSGNRRHHTAMSAPPGGLLTMIQNIGLKVFPWLNGHHRVVTQNYTASMWMFATLGLIGLGLALALRRADRKEGEILET